MPAIVAIHLPEGPYYMHTAAQQQYQAYSINKIEKKREEKKNTKSY